MAEGLEEEIIIIEDSDAANQSGASDRSASDQSTSRLSKKKLLLAGAGIGMLFLTVAALLLLFDTSKKQRIASMKKIEQKLEEDAQESVPLTQVENLIAKANYLYSSGSKKKALALYEKIAHFSEAISAYNLGVAQLKDAQYENALETFQKAIRNNEKRCVSAINAAVCSLHLKNEESFRYYIDLAYAYLPHERNSPLYSYYYTLIHYYNKNYLEALSALKNPTTKEYESVQNNLGSRINALFDNNYRAIESMESNKVIANDFSLGLLYARVGDLLLAKKYLQSAITKNIRPIRSQLALGYINLKLGQIQDASKEIENITDMFEEEVYKPYPVKVMLKEALFDPDYAAELFRNNINKTKRVTYQKIFYFSPYKIFNAAQTISYIRKGTANIYIDNVASAKEYLKKGTASSSVNRGIVNAIQKALSFELTQANKMLKKLIKLQPKHSILHYNLALTYAQMGNMVDAHKHFLHSYHLDAKNYLSGVYAVMTSELIDKKSTKLLEFLRDAIAKEETSEETILYRTLLHIHENNFLAALDWLEQEYTQRPLYLALDVIIGLNTKEKEEARKSAKKLVFMLPKEILPHMMYIDAFFDTLPPKEYAKEVMNYLTKQEFHFNDLYFGAHITRYLYIQQNLITGRLYFLREQLKQALETTTRQKQEITSALALASLYDKAYEESFTLYNSLIDDFKVRDAKTLFLGAVASIAADHHANAIALLELSKMKNPTFLESRYALGLLYLEAKNNKGAIIQLSKIQKNNFISEYFNFDIDLDKLLFEKTQKQNHF